MKKIYLFANWKMYLDYDESVELAKILSEKSFSDNIKMVVFPSALSLYSVKQSLTDVKVGAQNIYWVDKGGYTGEVSADMYKKVGCEYALVGHSERRHQFGESDENVRQKMEAVLEADLNPVLCVGETKEERDAGKTEQIVENQLRIAFKNLFLSKDQELIIAYEPVWAIGSGVTCSLFDCEKMHSKIREIVKELLDMEPVVLYGGSVRAENVSEYVDSEQVDGVLVGGASSKADSWLEIVDKVN